MGNPPIQPVADGPGALSKKTPITLHYTEKLIHRVVNAVWLRRTGWSYFVVVLVAIACFGYALAGGDRSWRVGVLGTISTFRKIPAPSRSRLVRTSFPHTSNPVAPS